MEKHLFISIFFLLIPFSALIFAQQVEDQSEEVVTDTTVKIVDIEDLYADEHPSASKVTLTMEYVPSTGEVRLHYICMAGNFDQGEAMNTSIAFFEKFATENKYKHYAHREKDKTRYFKDSRGIRMTEYIVYVMFSK